MIIHDSYDSMIEFRHLQTFSALVEKGNLSKAARSLNLSQPAVSHQIKALEEHLEVSLFERKSSPLRLTPAGERLYAAACQAERLVSDAERDVARIAQGSAGQLRIAVECHSCFDWLMPSMDVFRERWPDVEMDLVSGFHADPVGLLAENQADLVIVSHATARGNIVFEPLFRYEVVALMAHGHLLASKSRLTARDFARETLITYPIPDDRIDLIRHVLKPAGIDPVRRTSELTVAILQLVASRRGVAALPAWAVQPYLENDYVASRRIRKNGLFARLYGATTRESANAAYMKEFFEIMRRVGFGELRGILPLND